MPRESPFHIELSAEEAAELNRRAVRYTLPYFEVVRAKMILMAALGIGNDEIAVRLDTRREIVSQWRKRFFQDRLAGLEERARPGRPRQGGSRQRCEPRLRDEFKALGGELHGQLRLGRCPRSITSA